MKRQPVMAASYDVSVILCHSNVSASITQQHNVCSQCILTRAFACLLGPAMFTKLDTNAAPQIITLGHTTLKRNF